TTRQTTLTPTTLDTSYQLGRQMWIFSHLPQPSSQVSVLAQKVHVPTSFSARARGQSSRVLVQPVLLPIGFGLPRRSGRNVQSAMAHCSSPEMAPGSYTARQFQSGSAPPAPARLLGAIHRCA